MGDEDKKNVKREPGVAEITLKDVPVKVNQEKQKMDLPMPRLREPSPPETARKKRTETA